MKPLKRVLAFVLAICMILPMTAVRSQAAATVTGDAASGFTIVNENGQEEQVDDSWTEDYPYGIFAFGYSEMTVAEGEVRQVLTVYRLGGTADKASAVISYQPAVAIGADGGYDYSAAISADDITVEVEDPLPITAYQPWGMPPDPEETDVSIRSADGVDGEGESCVILSLDTALTVDSCQWYVLTDGEWEEIAQADGTELPVGAADLAEYDFRCVFTANGTSWCTDSYKGVAYEKPAAAVLPEAPANLELNPDPTYTELALSEGETPYAGWYFEVCFADGEYRKDILISAADDSEAEPEEFAALSITDCVGGEVLDSLSTLLLHVQDNDGDSALPAQIGFAETAVSFDKSDGTAVLTVTRTGGTASALSVDWSLEDGAAKAGVDYVSGSGTLYFYGSQTQQTIEIELINDRTEDLNEKDFTVRLSGLLGDDVSAIGEDTCTVGLYNSNTAQDLNLVSTLYDVDAVDVSASVTESAGAPVSAGTVTGEQVTDSGAQDTLSGDGGTCRVDWGDSGDGELDPLLYETGRVYFDGGGWSSTTTLNMSISATGDSDTNSTSKTVSNIGQLYSGMSATVTGGAKLASTWNRLWYGDKEYGYTYFRMNSGSTQVQYWDCSPNCWTSGGKVNLTSYSTFYPSRSWDYTDSAYNFVLGVAKYDSCGSNGNIDAAATVRLTRRTFNKNFFLDLYTANDSDIRDVAHFTGDNYGSIIQSVNITDGGTSDGKLYEGSTVQITLGNTHLTPSLAYIVDASGNWKLDGTISGKTVTFSNIILPPDGTYTFRLVLQRSQNINIDLTTSAEVDAAGNYVGGAESAFGDAYALLKDKNTANGSITVGYTAMAGNIYSTGTIQTKQVSIQNLTPSESGVLTTELVSNLQYINFNLGQEDVVLFNGKAYAGNETIWLETKHLTAENLTFYFYEENFLTTQRPMKATIDATAVYFDGSGNGRIDGYFDEASGTFVLDTGGGDAFVAYLADGDYEETQFQPVVDADNTVHQYFLRAYYTANPVCMVIPQGADAEERMQVMPGFITDVTDPAAYEALTDEQKQYRTIVSGLSAVKKAGAASPEETGYTADNHYKYTAAASAYSYVDIPLGGDLSPCRAVTSTDLDTTTTNGPVTVEGVAYMMKDGLAYYYAESVAGHLGSAVYTWEPDYQGSLLYPFDSPEPIYIANSLAGSRIPVTYYLTVWYLTDAGLWTRVPPGNDTETAYAKNALGAYITETRATDAGADDLNGYLGAFGGNDTYALMVCEQDSTTGEIKGGASGGDVQTITRGTVGAYPNADYLKQSDGNGADSTGDSSGEGSYEEFSADVDSQLFSFSSEALSLFNVETDGYEVSFSIGIPVYGKDSGGKTGSASNTFDDTKETAGKIRDFIGAIKNNMGEGNQKENLFSKLAGDDLDANKLKSKSIEFTVTVSLAITLKYNPLDNKYMFSEAALAVSAGIEMRLQYRFTPVPILYVYAQFAAEAAVKTGLGQERIPVIAAEDILLTNAGIKLYENPKTAGQSSQYYFTTDQKAFNLTFSGRLYMECYSFTDNDGDGKYGAGDVLGDAPDGFTPGYITSDGSKETEIVLLGQNGFQLPQKAVVVLTVMDDGDKTNNATATISSLSLISGIKQDLYWSGFRFDIEGSVEVGVGIGIEIAKAEIYAKASLGFAFTLGAYTGGGSYTAATLNEFTLAAGIGFRVVVLFFNYEMDLIEYHLKYEDGAGWSHGWSALGGKFGGDDDLSVQDADGMIDVYLTPPSLVRAQAYGNNVTGQADEMDDQAYDSNTQDFQVSGYGASVNAFQLLDGVVTGYDYQIVTVGDDNYVVYTGTRSGGGVAAVDNTELRLSRLEETDDTYGLVNPIAGQAAAGGETAVSVPVDHDAAGDLDFYAWAEGTKIHVLWVSYAAKTVPGTAPEGGAYTYDAAAGTGSYDATGGTAFTVNGTAMTAENYAALTFPEVAEPAAVTEPKESDYYTTTDPGSASGWKHEVSGGTTYYFPNQYDTLADAQRAYRAARDGYEAYTAYMQAKAAYEAWYAYFSDADVQNQVRDASQNTVVRHAVFDTTDEAADGFSVPDTVAGSADAYNFLPVSAGAAAVTARSVPYTEADSAARLAEYGAYLDAVLTSSGSDGTNASQSYIAASKAYRMAYQETLLSVYGGNSSLTVSAPAGTAYADGTMYVSRHQENGNGEAADQTNEILTNLQLAEIDGAYYLAYVTQQDIFEKTGEGESEAYTDLCSVSRLYLRRFTIEANTDTAEGAPAEKVVWGEPYLLRTIVNREQNSTGDGVYDAALKLKTGYTDPYIANLSFLTGALGDKLAGTSEDFEPFDATDPETFLLFEMNGNTYVIDQDSLKSITTTPAEGGATSGTISPFFTYEQLYGDALDKNSTENLSSGKSEVVIGADGDGNLAAVYTGSVPNTTNNAIYIAYWDPATGEWSAGVMLAMNYMDVYERAIANGWDAETAKAAYYDTASGGGMTQFTFSNLQIALGRTGGSSDVTAALDTMDETATETADAAATRYSGLLSGLGLSGNSGGLATLGDTGSEADLYRLTEQAELLGADTDAAADTPELLILTQGTQLELEKYSTGVSGEDPVIAPERDADGSMTQGGVGVYAISYGKGGQQVGAAAINFAYNEFTAGSRLYAAVSFKNVGDAAIRGSQDQPVTVRLMLSDDDGAHTVMATWEIRENIGAGQTVELSTDSGPCASLPADLDEDDYFYLTLTEDEDYTGSPYTYDSSSDSNIQYQFDVADKPELGVEGLEAEITGVGDDGDAAVELAFDVTNRGGATAEDVFVQLSYVSSYDGDGNAVYAPLDLTDSTLYVSQQKLTTDDMGTLGADELANGVLYLGTDSAFYTDDYYITAAQYNAILAQYYSTDEVSGWARGTYDGVTYWYNKLYYISAYAAYTAGQEAAAGWSYDAGSGSYYNNSYESYGAAKTAADAARLAEYIRTAAQYQALPAAEQAGWAACTDEYGYYVPAGYVTYAAAYAAYQAALSDGTQTIGGHYYRSVRGVVNVSPACFQGKLTGSLNLRVEVFSRSSDASRGSGLYTSSHEDEYHAANNAAETQLEQASFVSAAPRITLALGSTHRLPISVRTTTGEVPEITVAEVDDGADELSTLYYAADTDTDGVAATATGSLILVGSTIGSGVIHVVDTATNTTYPIAYTVAEQGDGINIYNDDAQFTFYNADGSLYDAGKTGQDWKFQALSSWTDALTVPYLGNVAIGEPGAWFTFQTKAAEISLNLIGTAAVTSDKFPGTFTLSNNGETSPPTSATADFGNADSVSHTVTVKVTGSTAAYLDTLLPGYSEGYVPPSDDRSSPGLYWSRSFPTTGSVKNPGTVELTVYAVDDSGLQSMTRNGVQLAAGAVTKLSDSLWRYTFTVTENMSFTVAATDTNGNTTTHRITADWFADAVPNPEYGEAPALTASAYKVFQDGSDDVDLFTGAGAVMTSEDSKAGNTVQLKATTTQDAVLSYYAYDPETAAFEEMTDGHVSKNGYYMVRADNDSYHTWSAQVFFVDCFENMPVISVNPAALTAPNGYRLDWAAYKDEESTAALGSVKLNGILLSSGMEAQATSYSGTTTVRYGGRYTFLAEDTKGVTGATVLDLNVPVDISASGVFAAADPWTQPESGSPDNGSITVDFSKITGGEYDPASAENAASTDAYYGSYEYVLLDEAACAGKALPESLTDGADSWLTALTWTSAGHDATVTQQNLSADADGTAYTLIIRDARNPKAYSAMAVKTFVLTDNSIQLVSLSARLASTAGAADGAIYVSGDRGATGAYEFAVLPVTDSAALTADDFKASSVVWYPADWAGEGLGDAVLDGLVPGRYQVAVRALYDGTDTEIQSMAALNAQGGLIGTARQALAQKRAALTQAAAAMEAEVLQAGAAWKDASENAQTLQDTYEDLRARLARGDASVTNADVDNAWTRWRTALSDETSAEAAFRGALTGATAEQIDALIALRAQWLSLPEGDRKSEARTIFEAAVYARCLDYQTQQFETEIQSAQEAVMQAEDAYRTSSSALADLSAAAYADDGTLWAGLLTGEALQIDVGFGSATSVKATPQSATPSAPDGKITATAMGGSAYDGGERVYYQFALLPLKNSEAAGDYSADMSAIGALALDWQFADDLADAPDKATFTGLVSGWYQVFVRTVYDPDLSDGYDVAENLYDPTGSRSSLASLRAAYDEAVAAAGSAAVAGAANAAHAIYQTYLDSGLTEDYQRYMTAIGSDATVLAALQSWRSAVGTGGEQTAYAAYRTALSACLAAQAREREDEAASAYERKLDEVEAQAAQAYADTPGYYDTASYAAVYVAARYDQGAVTAYEESGGSVTYTLQEHRDLLPDELSSILGDNRTREVRLIIGDRLVVIPAGTLLDTDEVQDVVDNYTGGDGDLVQRTAADGTVSVVPISLAEDGVVAYVYVGPGLYGVAAGSPLSFTDTAAHWARDYIDFATAHTLLRGVSGDRFDPEGTMTRGMLVTVLYRLMGEPAVSGTRSFDDVSADAWYADAVAWACEAGITVGVGGNLFAPDRPVTRAEAVTMLLRMLEAQGFAAGDSASLDGYADAGDVPAYAVQAFQWSVAAGIIGGDDQGRLSARDNATRAQMAAVFQRLVRYILK